jgi:segregation and condensation protein A
MLSNPEQDHTSIVHDVTLPEGVTGHEGVEILVTMAKCGQIDPWNLDLIAVADRFLETVQQRQASELRITGNVLLFLAILLRMKSDLLTHGTAFWLEDDALLDDTEPVDPWEADTLPLPNVVSLQTVLKRRTSVKQPRIRPVTLTDLIQELTKIETLESRQALKNALVKMDKRRHSVDLGNWTLDDIETMAHEEFVEDTIDTVSDAIANTLTQNQTMPFDQLVTTLAMDKVTVFLALLFLVARTDIELIQTEFYGTFSIRVC